MKHTKRTLKRMAAIMVAFAVAFTITPMISGDINVHAATAKKPAKVGSLRASATSQTTITLKWDKVKTKGTKGYMVYRYDLSAKKWLAVKDVKKATTLTFKDQKLKAGTSYKYRVRAYTTYKQYYNTKTKKWVNKRPAKKQWKTKLSRTKYKYGSYSAIKTFKTAGAVSATDKDAAFTKAKLSGSTTAKVDGNTYDYTTKSNGKVIWSLDTKSKNYATIQSTFASTKKTKRSCQLIFKAAGTVNLTVKSQKNKKSKTITITVTGNTNPNPDPDPDKKDKVTVTDYTGATHTYDDGAAEINNPRYNAAVDGWFDNNENTQRYQISGMAFAIRPYSDLAYYGYEVEHLSGKTTANINKLKFAVQNSTKSYTWTNIYTGNKQTDTYALKDDYRLVRYEEKTENSTRYMLYTRSGSDGFVSGDFKFKIYYDFDGNNQCSENELLTARTCEIKVRQARWDAITLCKQILGSEQGTWTNDMKKIKNYIEDTYTYGQKVVVGNTQFTMSCLDGAYILETWSIYKHKIYGNSYGDPNGIYTSESHVDFIVNDEHGSLAHTVYGAQGCKGE